MEFHFHRFPTPQPVEQLLYRINPACLDLFLTADHEIFTLRELDGYGYAGKEIFSYIHHPDQLIVMVYFETKAGWNRIPLDFLVLAERDFQARMGSGNAVLEQFLHEQDPLEKVAKFFPANQSHDFIFTRYHPPVVLEELTIQVTNGRLADYLEADTSIGEHISQVFRAFWEKNYCAVKKMGWYTVFFIGPLKRTASLC